MTDAEYVESELRKALREDAGEPVETVRIKAEGPCGSSRWVTVSAAEYETMITATVAAVAKRGE